jgi:predicted transposase YbfD/YdcC
VQQELLIETDAMAPSSSPQIRAFAVHFAALKDPRRVLARCRHSLLDLIVLAVVGVVCGADGWEELAEFAEARREWFATRLGITGDPPSESTLRRVLTALAPSAFAAGFASWAASIEQPVPSEGLAIDGKTMRGGERGESGPLHLVHAWATERGLLLGQQACESKGGELAAMSTLLDRLSLGGMVVTIDAAGCHKPIAQKVIEGGGDYALAVKANQRSLYESIAERFLDSSRGQPDLQVSVSSRSDEGHGRSEERTLWAAPASSVEAACAWPGAESVVAVRRRRVENGVASEEWRYFLSSLTSHNPERLAHVIRGHWGIENGLHWSLDVGFREDQSRIHERRAQENFATLRRFALTLIQKTPRRMGVAASRKKAGWNEVFLFDVLRRGITTV